MTATVPLTNFNPLSIIEWNHLIHLLTVDSIDGPTLRHRDLTKSAARKLTSSVRSHPEIVGTRFAIRNNKISEVVVVGLDRPDTITYHVDAYVVVDVADGSAWNAGQIFDDVDQAQLSLDELEV